MISALTRLVALAREAAPLMTNGGSIVAMTYYGAEKVVPHYNVMGVAKASLEASTRYLAYDLGPKKIRVNCISAGPVNTLAARGISGFIVDAEALPGTRTAEAKLRSGGTRARPESSSPATARPRLPARSSTSMAVIRSWGCEPVGGLKPLIFHDDLPNKLRQQLQGAQVVRQRRSRNTRCACRRQMVCRSANRTSVVFARINRSSKQACCDSHRQKKFR